MKHMPFAIGLGTLLAAVTPLNAQDGVIPLDSAAIAALAWLQPRIDSAAHLRFTTPRGASVLETPRLLPSGLAYRRPTNPGPHLSDPAFELQVRGRATLTGLQVGAGVAGFLGMMHGWLSGGGCVTSRDCVAPDLQQAVLGSWIGAAAGAVIGAFIGSLIPQWRTIFRYPEGAP